MTRQVLVNSVVYEVYIPTDSGGSTRFPGLTASDFTAFVVDNASYSVLTLLNGNGINNNSLEPDVFYIEEVGGSTGVYSLRFYPSNIGYKYVVITFVTESTETTFKYSITPNLLPNSDGVIAS